MNENKSPLLEIKDLEVEYKSRRQISHALNKVNFSINRKETLGIVGETGAGKTTTALSIMRLLPEGSGRIVGGSIEFDGTNLLSLSEKAMQKIRGERISMIFQDPMTSLNPVVTVGNQVYEALMLHNGDKMTHEQLTERTDEMFRLVGINPERKTQYPHEFSGGMKQRVVIAMALACSPELLIADEPTTALDVTIQAQVLDMMDELKQKLEMAMIMITHDLGIVAKTCDKVAVMYSGEIIEYGTFEDFFCQDERRHPYTAGLFGSIPNIDADEKRLHPIDGLMPDPTQLPEGCKFHPRCPHCMEKCRTQVPPDCTVNGHMVKCHLFAQEDN